MLNADSSALLIIDVQEKLVKMLGDTDITKNVGIVAHSASILGINTVITEQYPKGLGETVENVKVCAKHAQFFEKTSFSALQNEEVFSYLKKTGKKQIVLCGIEAHICVLQTALELLKNGFEVFLLKDCSASRNSFDFDCALDFLKFEGAKIITKEIALFMWLKGSKHPNFKEVQALIKNS